MLACSLYSPTLARFDEPAAVCPLGLPSVAVCRFSIAFRRLASSFHPLPGLPTHPFAPLPDVETHCSFRARHHPISIPETSSKRFSSTPVRIYQAARAFFHLTYLLAA
jgi:hypothetical protein